MYRTVDEICLEVEKHAAGGNRAAALDTIAEFVRDVIAYDAGLGTVFSSPPLDRACLALGRGLYPSASQERDSDQAVLIATALYKVGGHSRVLLDLAQADPAGKITILVTNLHHDYPMEQIEGAISYIGAGRNFGLEIAPFGTSETRLRWLQQRLFELRPARTYLLQHHQDSVCIAAAQPELVGKLFYVHHGDHALALGVHIPHAVHVDFSQKQHYYCSQNGDTAGNVIWPLTAQISRHRADKPFLAKGRARTATSGTTSKFDGSYLRYRVPYSIEYPQVVPVILAATGGTHLHIGFLSAAMLKDIAERMARAGIEQDRFIYVPQVADLADALVEHDVDAYIGSFPFGGGRALAQAMGVGLPIIVHSQYRSVFFSAENETYDDAMVWCTVEDLARRLQSLTRGNLERHARLARSYFEEHHTPERLRARMHATFAGNVHDRSAPPRHHPNPLQAFLDEQTGLARWTAGLRDERDLAFAERDRAAGEVDRQSAELTRLRAELARVRLEQQQLSAALDASHKLLEAMHQSRSWRLTAPMRQIRAWLGGPKTTQ